MEVWGVTHWSRLKAGVVSRSHHDHLTTTARATPDIRAIESRATGRALFIPCRVHPTETRSSHTPINAIKDDAMHKRMKKENTRPRTHAISKAHDALDCGASPSIDSLIFSEVLSSAPARRLAKA